MKSCETVLAIETSCDETAVSIVVGEKVESKLLRYRVLAHKIDSQVAIHRPFGGVVPEVAARDHLLKIDLVAKAALEEAGIGPNEVDRVAVTMGPGLIGALMVGILYARGFALARGIPLTAINHVDAHLAPALFMEDFQPDLHLGIWQTVPELHFPALALTVSGGHCHLSLLQSPAERLLLGTSLDDACGEAFDKVAKMLGMPYPGGPHIERLAKLAVGKNPFVFPATLANLENRTNFSYSGLKTSIMHALRKLGLSGPALSDELKNHMAKAFQDAALGQLENRVRNALADAKGTIRTVFVAGGVAANSGFRERFGKLGVPVRFAPIALCSDNATMIALHAFLVNDDGFVRQAFTRYSDDEAQRRTGNG